MARQEYKTLNWLHEGYMDGILGVGPDEDLGYPGSEYETGWLLGSADREAGIPAPKYPAGASLPALKGVEITIPKGTNFKSTYKPVKVAGRTYKVKAHDVIPGVPAYFDEMNFINRQFVRPTSATVLWAGSGGYWTQAKLEDVKF